jgi:hypothetical protein
MASQNPNSKYRSHGRTRKRHPYEARAAGEVLVREHQDCPSKKPAPAEYQREYE